MCRKSYAMIRHTAHPHLSTLVRVVFLFDTSQVCQSRVSSKNDSIRKTHPCHCTQEVILDPDLILARSFVAKQEISDRSEDLDKLFRAFRSEPHTVDFSERFLVARFGKEGCDSDEDQGQDLGWEQE